MWSHPNGAAEASVQRTTDSDGVLTPNRDHILAGICPRRSSMPAVSKRGTTRQPIVNAFASLADSDLVTINEAREVPRLVPWQRSSFARRDSCATVPRKRAAPPFSALSVR
ncbi:hypothetical protein RE943_16840 [Prescottella equi]|nr:hypothetical protein RE943_16840 [Prescottella equi]